MSKANSVDRRVGEAARALPSEPIHWEAVRRLARRRRRLRALRLVGLIVLIALALAGAVVAAKAFFDPTYSPPIFSPATVSGSTEVSAAGLVPPSELPGNNHMGVTANNPLGYLMKAEMTVRGLQGEQLVPLWRLREVGKAQGPRFKRAQGSLPLRLRSQSEGKQSSAWLPAPAESGRYVAEVRFVVPGEGTLEILRSNPRRLVGRRWGRTYETRSYEARLPRGWKLESDYELASPHRYVSRARGPGGVSVRIDTTLAVSGDPRQSEHELEALLQANEPGYHRLGVSASQTRGPEMVEWSYAIEQRRYTDELFYRGGNGFGILGVSSQAGFRRTRDICRVVARSIRTKGQR